VTTDISSKTKQLGMACRHYDGHAFFCGTGGCKIGHPIRDIVTRASGSAIGIAFKLPCRPGPERAAQCPDYDAKTDEEIEAERESMRAYMDRVAKMIAKAAGWRKQMVAKEKRTARANCPCCGGKGTVRLTCAIGYNNHVWAECSECKVGFRE
jgi:hypothetical protein